MKRRDFLAMLSAAGIGTAATGALLLPDHLVWPWSASGGRVRLSHRRQAFGGYFVPREGAMRSVPAIVRAGGGVVLFLDQRGRKKPILADFFGRPAHSDRSAGVLVRRVGAPLVVLACYATECPWRYRMVFQRIVTPEELSGSSPAQVMAIINREMEVLIRRHPEQYFWLHDRYKGAPASSPPPPA